MSVHFLKRIIIFCLLSSCTFESKQLNLITSIINNNQSEVTLPQWSLFWYGAKTDIYAINHANAIVFANKKNQLLIFREKQITRTSGLTSKGEHQSIQIQGNDILYYENETLLRIDNCNNWLEIDSELDGIKVYNQTCFHENYESYKNIIIFGVGEKHNEKIIGLKYKIHPIYPQVEIIMNDYKDLSVF